MPPLAGNLVGHYQILCQVGAGGMGTVFKAFDTTLQRTVALKFLTPNPINIVDRDALLREARAASTLDHKNIGTVHAIEETDDGHLFLVMAYYEGQSLASRMTGPPFPVFEAVEIVQQIAEGLGHAHLHNIVHRDVKPSNVILTSGGEAKIVDFGLARFVRTALAGRPQDRYQSCADLLGDLQDFSSLANRPTVGRSGLEAQRLGLLALPSRAFRSLRFARGRRWMLLLPL